MTGRLVAIVGPSGVGKDSVMTALAARHPGYVLARRVITRPSAAGGEDFDSVTPAEFRARVEQDAFALHWEAHGLNYGIPQVIHADLAAGHDVLANLSREVLPQMVTLFPTARIIHLSAPADVLAARLTSRGRETPDQIAVRLARATFEIPPGLQVTVIPNDEPLEQTVAALHGALHPLPNRGDMTGPRE